VISLQEMSIGEIAAYVADHLRRGGINVVLTGGSCVSIYTDNRYKSYDLDFIEKISSGRKKIAGILMQLLIYCARSMGLSFSLFISSHGMLVLKITWVPFGSSEYFV
jgi:hypothetical protein